MGVEVTLWREDKQLLGAAEAVNHATQLLAVQYPVVPVLPHVEKTGQQPQSPLLTFWNLLHSKCILHSPAGVSFHLLHQCLLSEVAKVSACCGSWIISNHPGQNSDLFAGRGEESSKETGVTTKNLVP